VNYKVGSSPWTTTSQAPATTTKVALRPYSEFVPSSYSSNTPAPLVVLLHGYGSSGKQQESYMNFTAVAEQRGFILAYPDGTVDLTGKQFWNATEVCCNFFSNVDDDAYLISMLNDMESKYSIDHKRIYFVGHSNGGFMSYRMACKHSDRIAAIASLAGATFLNSSDCAAKDPVSVLQVHGTSDATILYNGGAILEKQYPSATASVTQWATFNRCSNNAVTRADKLDLVNNIVGSETSITSWNSCRNGTEVELWTLDQGVHTPALSTTFASKVYDFLASHPKS
jgi:polyhydroxybutyrate depolymerase